MRNAEELFNDYIDFDTCTYTNEELKKDAILAMEAYAKEYHESKVKTLALPVVNDWLPIPDDIDSRYDEYLDACKKNCMIEYNDGCRSRFSDASALKRWKFYRKE